MNCLDRIRNDIVHRGVRYVFSTRDFLHHCEYDSIRQALAKLAKEGDIRRILPGIYDKPAFSSLLHEYAEPSPGNTTG